MASFEDFSKLDLRVGKVISAEQIKNSKKLLKLTVDIGTEERQLVAGIGQVYTPEQMVGKLIIVIANLEPRRVMGIESNGMLLAAGDDGNPVLLCPEKELPLGSAVH